jgi:hypothetical protein
VKHLLPRDGRQVRIDRQPGYPCELLSREHEWPTVALLARHARVHEDVLELARSATTGRPESKTRAPEANSQLETGAKVRGLAVVTPGAAPHLEAWRVNGGTLRGDDFHAVPHDTETQAARKVYASTAPAGTGQPQHGSEMRPRQAGLAAAGLRVEKLQRLRRRGFLHRKQSSSAHRT